MKNILIEKLVLGTVQLGMPYGINNSAGQPSKKEALKILESAAAGGIKTLDTADAYGTAIERIGEFHATSPTKFRIITKFHAEAETNLLEKTPQTLTKLHVSSLHTYQFHRFSDIADFPHLRSQLEKLKKLGLITRIGVSVYTNEEIIAAARLPIIDVIQFPFNLLDNMRLRGDSMRIAHDAGKELHTRSVFLQGLFFKQLADIPPKLAPLMPYIQRLHRLQEKGTFAQNVNATVITLQSLALNYALHNPLISSVLFGVETLAQLRQILDSVQENFDQELQLEIERIVVKEPSLLNPVNWNT
ncbi:MAG: aldo/keto reductase [Candidatus Kapabacteria bacterium]|jgi:aryl-alcohol dehydrogenase-like predicted oxidoreductase|nr:aldo/keto reductase [Candidatus Kapabacteria bacterium]